MSEEYGFKLSTSSAKQDVTSNRSPLNDAGLKPITNPTEFKALFDLLEWSDGGDLTLIVELKRKDAAAIATAAAASAAAPAAAPAAKVPAYVPVQAHGTTAPATVALGSVGANGKVVGERDPNYFNNMQKATPAPTPSCAAQNRFNQTAEPVQPSPSKLSERLGMFGGATSVVARKLENDAPVAPAPVFHAKPYQPAVVTVVPLPSPPTGQTSMTFAQPMSFAAQPLQPISVVRSPQYQPQQVTTVSSAGVSGIEASTSFLRINDPTPIPVSAPAPTFVTSANRSMRMSIGADDNDLPAAPSGFVDPFTVNSSHPPLPSPPTAGGGPTFQVAKVFTVGDADLPGAPEGFSPFQTQVASVKTSDRPEIEVAKLSAFLAQLKPNTAQLAFLYATDEFQQMLALCNHQIALYNSEVESGLLQLQSIERSQALNGLLLYLFNLSLAYSSLQQFPLAMSTAERFQSTYSTLPDILQDEPVNSSMLVQLLHNSGLTLERQGDVQGAIGMMKRAVERMEKSGSGDASSSTPASSNPSFSSLRSSIYSSLGNLYTSLRDFDSARQWHTKAVESEEAEREKRWAIFHAAASCFAQSGDFAKATAFDSQAIDIASASSSGGLSGPLNPRVYFNRGLAKQKLNEWQESVEDFTRVLALDATNTPKAYTLRAKANLQLQNWPAVVADCQTVLKLTPADNAAREYLAFAQGQLSS